MPERGNTKPKKLPKTLTEILNLSSLSLSIKIAQKPYIIGSLGPKALKYECFEGKGMLST